MDQEWESRLARAEELAKQAGKILCRYFGSLEQDQVVCRGARDLSTIADKESEAFLVRELALLYPGEAVLAEEGVVGSAGKSSGTGRWLWILDPLDGTTNFVHAFPHFAVSLGLWRDGEPYLGVVHEPVSGETFTGVVGKGAWVDGRSIQVSRVTVIRDALLCTGFPYGRGEEGMPTNLDRFPRALLACQGMRRTGCISLDLSYLAAGRLDAFWEIGPGPYDMGAGAAIVKGAGGRITDLLGGKDYLFTGRVAASNGVLHEELLTLVGDENTAKE